MRHRHTLSHYKLLTGDMGQLLPIGLVEVLPKDTFQHSASVFLRLSPMAAPVMHPVSVRIHHFFVPHRLTWPTDKVVPPAQGWEAFITGGVDGTDNQVIPTIATSGTESDLFDYLGLPVVAGINVSQLPIRAFNMVYNEYYRDQDLVPLRDEDDVTIPLVAWEKDYLTMARPFTQKGDPVTVPLGARAPVSHDAAPLQQLAAFSSDADDFTVLTSSTTNLTASATPESEAQSLYADLSKSEGVDINTIRKAFALQRYQEARARYGSRYTEYLRYLGVNPSDARLQRPEYLGGGTARVSMSEVLQTTHDVGGGETERFGVGDMFGHGVASTKSNRYRRTFEEHGYVLSLLSVRPKAMYLDGVSRAWLKRTKEDYWQKELEHIGQQEVWQGEVFSDPTPSDTYDTFGFQDRYREYREENSRVAGEFRTTLNYWHMGREFETTPVLNQSFTDCEPTKRIYNVQDQHSLWIAVQHNLVARRLVARNASSRIM